MKRILFVDDEPNVLNGLKRMLFPMQKKWQMEFATSGRQALEIMQKQPFDLIVTDMRMPGMDGTELLRQVRSLYPETIRFVLSGQLNEEMSYKYIEEAHQYLPKPCTPAVLKDCIERAFALHEHLAGSRVKNRVMKIGALPALPETYAKLLEELQLPECSMAHVSDIIEKDIAMSVKILQLVNSACFGLHKSISSAGQAASLLGIGLVKILVLTVGVFSSVEKIGLPDGFSLNVLWRHSKRVGRYARQICVEEKFDPHLLNEVYTAGMLHDVGKVILAAACPDDFAAIQEHASRQAVSLIEAEREILNCSHADIGAFMLGIWGLPNNIIEAAAYHHQPAASEGKIFSMLTAVHAANVIFYQLNGHEAHAPQLDVDYLRQLGMESRFEAWKRLCMEINRMEEDAHE